MCRHVYILLGKHVANLPLAMLLYVISINPYTEFKIYLKLFLSHCQSFVVQFEYIIINLVIDSNFYIIYEFWADFVSPSSQAQACFMNVHCAIEPRLTWTRRDSFATLNSSRKTSNLKFAIFYKRSNYT